MTLQIATLTMCPFCQRGHGGIYVNTVALAERLRHEDGDGPRNLAEEADQQIVLINNANTVAKSPCEHLLQITADLSCGVFEGGAWQTRAGVSFNWLSPVVTNSDPQHVATRHLWDNAPLDDEAELDWMETPNRVSDITVAWRGSACNRHYDLHFHVQGSVAFAEDVAAFIEELQTAEREECMVWQL